jgi:hypothetical protein
MARSIDRHELEFALTTLEELIGVYTAQADSMRRRSIVHLDNLDKKREYELAAAHFEAVRERLERVRSVVADSLKRRRFSRKRR